MTDRRERSRYFHAYYLAHREAILAKNRAWFREHPEKPREYRARRRANVPPPPPRACADCGAPTVRAERCRRCSARHRYRTDPAYRARRLALNRRWAERRRAGA